MRKRKMILAVVIASVLAGSGTSSSAEHRLAGEQQWVRRYNGTYAGADYGGLVATDASGNVYVAGQSFGYTGTTLTGDDIVVLKYNSAGAVLWSRRYNGPAGNGLDTPKGIALDTLGNVVVTGMSFGTRGVGLPDIVTIKWNANGSQAWARRYWSGTGGHEEGRAVATDTAGNVYVAGVGSSSGAGLTTDGVLVKYSPAGTQLWAKRYNAPFGDNDGFVALAAAPNGDTYSVGYTTTSGLNLQDALVVKHTGAGARSWVRTYNGEPSVEDWAEAVVRDAAGNVIVTGARGEGCHDDLCYSYLTIKYSATGERRWVRLYNPLPESDDVAHSVAVDGAGNVFVTGQSAWTSAFYDVATVKYSSGGTQRWVDRWDGAGQGNDHGYDVAVDANGNAIVAGSTYTSLARLTDWVTIKYTPTGARSWVRLFDDTSHHDDMAFGVALGANGVSYVSGFGTGDAAAKEEIVTVKYAP